MTRNDPTLRAQPARRMFRFLAGWAFALLVASFHSTAASASVTCDSLTKVWTGLPTSLTVAPGTAAGAALGAGPYTATFTFTNCTGPSGSTVTESIPSGTALTPIAGITGINFQVVGTPSYTKSASCPTVTITPNSDNYSFTLQALPLFSYTGCTVTFTVSGRFYLGTARIVGTQIIPATGFGLGYAGATSFNGGFNPGAVSLSGTYAIPVYVAACAGVLNGTQTVQLPTISASTFASPQTWSDPVVGITRFQLSLANCVSTATNGVGGNSGYQAHIAWSFTPYQGNATLIANAGTSSVAIQILKANPRGGTSIRSDAEDIYTLTDGTNIFTYYAGYYRNDPFPTPGSVSAIATFTVTYQ